MIKSITVKNVKSHKDTTLHLCEGVNVIVGRSQAGKSAFLGAFNWLRNNRPSGISKKAWFARSGAEMSTEVVTTEGEVSLTKSVRDARYEVNGEVLRKFKQTVPEEVTELLNISDLNIQNQLDSHYLIISGPPEVARVINDVTGLAAFDPAFNWCTNQTNQRNSTISALEEQLIQRKKDLEAYKDVDVWDEELLGIEKLFAEHQRVSDRIERLDEAVAEVEEMDDELEELREVDFEKCKDLVRRAEMGIEEIAKLVTAHKNVKAYTQELVEVEADLANAKQSLSKFKDEYREQLKKLGKCPLCLSDVKGRIDKIVENL